MQHQMTSVSVRDLTLLVLAKWQEVYLAHHNVHRDSIP